MGSRLNCQRCPLKRAQHRVLIYLLNVYLILSLLLHRHFSPTTLPLTQYGYLGSVRLPRPPARLARSTRLICNLETVTAYRHASFDRPEPLLTSRTQTKQASLLSFSTTTVGGSEGVLPSKSAARIFAPACVRVHFGKRKGPISGRRCGVRRPNND